MRAAKRSRNCLAAEGEETKRSSTDGGEDPRDGGMRGVPAKLLFLKGKGSLEEVLMLRKLLKSSGEQGRCGNALFLLRL